MTIFFYILIGIVTLVMFGILLIKYSFLKIEIKEFKFIDKEVVEFNIILSLNLFNKLKWLQLTINKNRIDKLKSKGKTLLLNKILNSKILKDYKEIGKGLFKNWKNILKIINEFKIRNFNLFAKVGLDDAPKTAYTIGIISSILAIILSRKTDNPKYIIKPVYTGKNTVYFSINCILVIKLVHIIHISKDVKRKEVYQYNGRTSNRRPYANSNG